MYQIRTLIDLLFQNEQHMRILHGTETLFTDSQVYHEFYNYADFFYIPLQIPDVNPFSAPMDLLDCWNNYISLNVENLYRESEALYAEYNPVENYSMLESGIDGTKRDKMTTETTPTGETTVTNDIDRFGMDSSTGNPYDKTTNTESFTDRKDTTEVSYDNTMSSDFDGVTHSGYNESREHFFQRTGNIGTMTAADMIQKEQRIRQNNLLTRFVLRFIMKHCFYVS